MAHISIKNVGPIASFDLDVKQFNVLIGEQATGKSTVAKGIYFFRLIRTKLIEYLVSVNDTGSYKEKRNLGFHKDTQREFKDIFVNLFGFSWDQNPNMSMRYNYTSDVWAKISIDESKKYFELSYSQELIDAIKELRKQCAEDFEESIATRMTLAELKTHRQNRRVQITNDVNKLLADDMESYYIPAGRSLLTVMSANHSAMSNVKNLDVITEQFMGLIDSIRADFTGGLSGACRKYRDSIDDELTELVNSIIDMQKGEYRFMGGTEVLSYGDQRRIGINFASSGQQEILWLLNFLFILILRNEKSFVVIEEPEAHIYPTLQKKLVEFIVRFANQNNNAVFVTTHSPYVLTVMNNLYYAGCLADKVGDDKISPIVNKKTTISKNKFSANKLEYHKRGSKACNMIDIKACELKSELIDEVSESVNELYTALYDVELDYLEEND